MAKADEKIKISRSNNGVQHDVTVTISVGSVFAPEDWEMGKTDRGTGSFYANDDFDFGTSDPVVQADTLSDLREKTSRSYRQYGFFSVRSRDRYPVEY